MRVFMKIFYCSTNLLTSTFSENTITFNCFEDFKCTLQSVLVIKLKIMLTIFEYYTFF